MLNETIAIYAIIDDLLKAIGFATAPWAIADKEDCRRVQERCRNSYDGNNSCNVL